MTLIALVMVLLFSSVGKCDLTLGSLQDEKKEAISRLKARKKGFDKYQALKEQWRKNRLARANEIKAQRKKYADKMEKARQNFVRIEEEFPEKAYRQFIRERNQKRKQYEKIRKEYAKMQKELKKIFENKEYLIDGKKEFEL